MKKLYRSTSNKKLLGVCGGLAKYFGVDPTIVRLAWVIVSLIPMVGLFLGVLTYIISGIVIPIEPDYIDVTEIKDEDE
ncbi:MAG: phage shock protein [Clostridia bacterium]|nr:phage shock protein [Clostridia bacterium]MDN5321610.1 phage shock protein [Clostridia bacterium]